jgi:hypothetical protein
MMNRQRPKTPISLSGDGNNSAQFYPPTKEDMAAKTFNYVASQPDFQAICALIDINAGKGNSHLIIDKKDYPKFDGVWAEIFRRLGYTVNWGDSVWVIWWVGE